MILNNYSDSIFKYENCFAIEKSAVKNFLFLFPASVLSFFFRSIEHWSKFHKPQAYVLIAFSEPAFFQIISLSSFGFAICIRQKHCIIQATFDKGKIETLRRIPSLDFSSRGHIIPVLPFTKTMYPHGEPFRFIATIYMKIGNLESLIEQQMSVILSYAKRRPQTDVSFDSVESMPLSTSTV